MEHEDDTKHIKVRYWRIIGLVVAVAISILIFLFRDSFEGLVALGYVGIFWVMLLGSATVLLPAPALMFVFAAGGTLGSPLLVGLLAGIGSTMGEGTGYIAGVSGSGLIEHSKLLTRIKRLVAQHGAWVITLLAFVPNPFFDFAGIAAGALKMRWQTFFAAALVGKLAKCLLIAYAGSLSVSWVEQLLLK